MPVILNSVNVSAKTLPYKREKPGAHYNLTKIDLRMQPLKKGLDFRAGVSTNLFDPFDEDTYRMSPPQ